jgi:hypothetical protein
MREFLSPEKGQQLRLARLRQHQGYAKARSAGADEVSY